MATDALSAILAEVFANGRGAAGLEIGTDPGLPRRQYIQVPRRMVKNWAAKVNPDTRNLVNYEAMRSYLAGREHVFNHPAGSPEPLRSTDDIIAPYAGSAAAMAGQFGWITSGNLLSHIGHLYLEQEVEDTARFETDDVLLDDFYVDAPTVDDVRAFYTVNVGHIDDEAFDEATRLWIHATRYWSVTSGLVATTKQAEWTIVDNPTHYAAGADEFAQFCVGFRENAWTASAARATSWRKTNHATGGTTVTGFPRRWIQKMGFAPRQTDRAQASAAWRVLTNAFYVATHASSVHAVLALMAPTDRNHWACIDPKLGLLPKWDLHTSARIRMTPNTQVAGAAMVTDAFVVLKMLVREGLAPLLVSSGEIQALRSAYDTVETQGICCATYARWFLDGHPDGNEPIEFSQKDPAHAELVGELGIVAKEYYRGTTIAGSLSLENAATQMANEVARNVWQSIGRQKETLSEGQVTTIYARIRGASTAASIRGLASDTPDVAIAAVRDYNAALDQIAGIVGVPVSTRVDEDTVRAAVAPPV